MIIIGLLLVVIVAGDLGLLNRDCADLYENFGVRTSGEYTVTTSNGVQLKVYCDMDTDGGGWTVLQRRVDGEINFYRGWSDYVKGFGLLSGEFWLGLDHINQLAHADWPLELRVDMWNCSENHTYEVYSTFYVADEYDNFRLSVAEPFGSAGDAFNAGNSLARVNGFPFTTYDVDNDNYMGNCAKEYNSGGWWFNRCFQANLNGQYNSDCQATEARGIIWASEWYLQYYSMKRAEMKVKPRGFPLNFY